MSKKRREEYVLFLNNNRITYHPVCRRCRRDCKQAYRIELLRCPNFVSKRSVRP